MKKLIFLLTTFLLFQSIYGQNTAISYGLNNKAGNYADINGERIYYEIYGKGFPLILLHGGLGSISEFKGNIADLAREFQVIAVDNRGYGRSTNNADSLSYSLMTEDIMNLIDYLKLDSVDIVGFSDGGIIGLKLASKYPTKIHKVVASGANCSVTDLKSTWFQDNLMLPENVIKNAFWNEFREAYKTNPNPEKFDKHIQLVRKMWITEPYINQEEYKKISKPVFLVFGDREDFKMSRIIEMFEQLPEDTRQLCIFPRTSHFTFDERSGEINKLIIEFLNNKK